MSRIEFKPIPYLGAYGYIAAVGDRDVEILRAHLNEWFIFARIDGKICKAGHDEPSHETYAQAKRRAIDFLNRKVTFEVWPNKGEPQS